METQRLSGQLPRRQWARVGQRAVGLTLHVALLLPLGEVAQRRQFRGVLHPLDDLKHCDEVDVVAIDHLIDELDELLDETLVLLEPGRMEVQAEGSAIAAKVPVEVVP